MFNKKILTFLYKYRTKVDLKIFNTTQINSINISNYLKNLKNKLFLVSLYSGKKGIIKDKTLLKKNFSCILIQVNYRNIKVVQQFITHF